MLTYRRRAPSVSASWSIRRGTVACRLRPTFSRSRPPSFASNRCTDHVAAEDVVKALQAQYGLWRMHLQGAFVRRLLLEYDVDPARIEGLVDDAIDAITKELNLRFESAEENTHA